MPPGLPGQIPSADSAVLAMLIDDLGRWLAAEYTAVRRLIVKSSTTPALMPSRPVSLMTCRR